MSGISNRPEPVEDNNQQRVEQRKAQLPDLGTLQPPKKDHPVDKDQEDQPAERGRVSETGAGRGTDHTGH